MRSAPARPLLPARASQQQIPSVGEEVANSVSHGVGFLAATAVVPVLVLGAVGDGPAAIVGVSVFGATLVLLYLASTLYHAFGRTRAGTFFRTLDHTAIYLLIAGTYTPFALGALRGPWGWTLIGIIWGLALGGIVLKAVHGFRWPRLSVTLYLAMGWLAVVAAGPLVRHVATWGLIWLVAGGLAYTAGVGFYRARRLRYAHFVWHLFVLAGTACHVIAVHEFAV